MWSEILALYEGYIGTGMISGLFLVALIYLFVAEKNKNIRIVFLYMPLVLLVLYFCPVFAAVVHLFTGEEIYYRLLWLVPVVPVLAYAAVKIIAEASGKKKIPAGIAMAGIFLISGRLVYQSPFFTKAENRYHVPQTVVEICDTIQSGDELVKAVFPKEFLQYVRQYNAYIWMPYGREILVERWGFQYDLYDLLEAEVLEVDKIVSEAHAQGCQYIIISEEKKLNGSFPEHGYELLDVIDGYCIYWDSELFWYP